MGVRRTRWWYGAVAALAAVALVGGGVWIAFTGDEEEGSSPLGAVREPDQEVEPEPRFELNVKVRKVRGIGPGKRIRPKRLKAPKEAVRQTMTELYGAGFVDRRQWEQGFGSVPPLFVGPARKQAKRELEKLTLGPTAAHLDAVRPIRAGVGLRFAFGRGKAPVAALARMDFAGTGIAEDAELPIRHGGDFILRKEAGRWRIASYTVRGKVPSPQEVERKVARRFAPDVSPKRTRFYLAIGSDARPGEPVAGKLADSIHIIGVNPKRGGAGIVGIPRDSFVLIPGRGTRKINEALFLGGPELMVRTVENLSGIKMDGYLLTGFEDFRRMVKSVGGIKVRIPQPMSDPSSGAFFRKGVKRLSGKEALAFSRNRKGVAGGDFGRSLNQGRLILAALREFRKDFRENPATLLQWLVVGAQNIKTDLGLPEMLQLLLSAPTRDLSRVENTVVSGSGGSVGGQSVVRLGAGAQGVFRDLRRDGMLRKGR